MAVPPAPSDLHFEHHSPGRPVLGIGIASPRLSWHLSEAPAGYRQGAYQLEVRRGDRAEVVEQNSGDQVLVPWPVAPLGSRERAEVRVRVRDAAAGDDEQRWSAWSGPAVVEAGLLDESDWTARFVSPVRVGALNNPAPVLRATVEVPADVARARLYITAHGLHVPVLNGQRVSEELLAPGWTAYEHRLRYQTYDVTGLLQAGQNVLEVLLGNGWFRGRLGFHGQRGFYGDRLALLAQLEVTTEDGSVHVLGTDGSWTARESGVLADDLYDGQRTDLRLDLLGSEDHEPDAVEVVDADLSRLVAPDGPPVRVTDVLPATEVITSPSGRTLVDFGQNLVGWVRLRVRGLEPGTEVTLRHAEVLENGELGVRPLRSAKATDSYLVAGGGEETLEPLLTFHGFRYAEVSGVPGLEPSDIEAVVIGSDLRRTGWFESSHDLLNRFHENVVWGMRGNFVDVPTDCPQRDERLGWTGDIQVFSPTATFLFDSAGFLTNWMADLAAEQQKDGSVPFVVPDILRNEAPAAAAWGDAATVVPWVVYERTGDLEVLRRQLPSMAAWVDHIDGLAGPDHLWAGGFQFGDWLDPTAPPDEPAEAAADPDVVATAHLARSAELLGRAAQALGDADTAQRYGRLAAEARAAFAREYVTGNGRVLSDAQTAYALAIEWALLPTAEQRERAGQRLADLVRTAGFRISTGFVGTPLITDALTSVGAVDVAYRLLLQTGCPSWLYSVTMGATTVWERWDSMLPDGSINPGQMTSFNHYALGAVADWMHRTIAGLAPAAPAYREILVRPLPHRALTSASAAHETPYGRAEVAWRRQDGRLTLEIQVPVGSTATVHVPGESEPALVEHGRHTWEVADPCPAPAPLAGDATVRDLLDHPEALAAVVRAAGRFTDSRYAAVTDEADLGHRLRAHLAAPLSSLPEALHRRAYGAGLQEFTERLEEALAPYR
jgi:alpha-L-rhamnosidase